MGAWVLDQGNPPAHGLIGFNENGIPVGVEESSIFSHQSSVKVYPNPASNTISLASPPGIEIISIEIIDIQGKVVMHQKVTNHNHIFNVSHFPKGIYFIQIHTSKGLEVKKLIIQ